MAGGGPSRRAVPQGQAAAVSAQTPGSHHLGCCRRARPTAPPGFPGSPGRPDASLPAQVPSECGPSAGGGSELGPGTGGNELPAPAPAWPAGPGRTVHVAPVPRASPKQPPERRGRAACRGWCGPPAPFLGTRIQGAAPARCPRAGLSGPGSVHVSAAQGQKTKQDKTNKQKTNNNSRLSIPRRCQPGGVPGQGAVCKVPSMDSQGQTAFLFQFPSSSSSPNTYGTLCRHVPLAWDSAPHLTQLCSGCERGP